MQPRVRYGIAYPSGYAFTVNSDGYSMRVVERLGTTGLALSVTPRDRMTIGAETVEPGAALVLDPRAYVFTEQVDGRWYCDYSPYVPKHLDAIAPTLRELLEQDRERWTTETALGLLESRQLRSVTPKHTDRPWMNALEMRFEAISALRGARRAESPQGVLTKEMNRPLWMRLAGYDLDIMSLSCAETYSWSRDTVSATLLASKSVPAHTQINMPSGCAWWWFDRPIDICELHQEQGRIKGQWKNPSWKLPVSGLLIHADDKRTWFRPFHLIDDGLCHIAGGKIGSWFSWYVPSGARIDEFANIARTDATTPGYDTQTISLGCTRLFAAGCAWLQQRIVSIGCGPVERHRRKQLAREFRTPLPTDVKVVQLRRYEPAGRQDVTADSAVDWSCRWVVNGHWRNQYHPSTGEHQLKYILPYVKGPDDKPLRETQNRVYVVNR